MFNERVQVLLSAEQRRRLEAESARRRTSVAALVREAIDARFEPVDHAQRRAAYDELARLAARRSAAPISPEELRDLIDDSHTEEILRGIP